MLVSEKSKPSPLRFARFWATAAMAQNLLDTSAHLRSLPAAPHCWRPSPLCTVCRNEFWGGHRFRSCAKLLKLSSPVRPKPGNGSCIGLHFRGRRARIQLPPLRSVPGGQVRQAWPQTRSFAASQRFCGLGQGWAEASEALDWHQWQFAAKNRCIQ